MKLILLAGSGKGNIDWVEKVDAELQSLFDETLIFRYSHWESDERKEINLDLEKSRLLGMIPKEEYAIFAKSAGILVALKATLESENKPKYKIFCGLPINWADERNIEIDSLLTQIKENTVLYQNSDDPMGSYQEVLTRLNDIGAKNYKLVKLSGDTHKYDNLSDFKSVITNS